MRAAKNSVTTYGAKIAMSSVGQTAAASVQRRLRFASACRYRVERTLGRLRMPPPRVLSEVHTGAILAFDLLEIVRTRGQVSHPGRPNQAALTAPGRVAQPPRYRGYWYDPTSHSLVGQHLGLDLHRNRGKYYVLESNVGPALRPERRRLYRSEVDPLISELILAARAKGFEKLVFCRDAWSKAYAAEFERASRASGIEVVGASWPGRGESADRPAMALPEPLGARTVYVLCGTQATPLSRFLHDKLWSARWLKESIETARHPGARLAYVPTSDRLVLPGEPSDPRWPNLVVKLADYDRGEFVAMGRFRTEAEARRALQLGDDDARAVPGIFDLGWRRRIGRRLFPGSETVYQPFIPSEVIANRTATIRLNVFVSPLFDRFLAAQARIADKELPDRLAPGLVADCRPFKASFSSGSSSYARVGPAAEDELRVVADEFGRLASLAISRKFETGP